MNKNQQASCFPLVSVIIPAYNAEIFIEETLKSVLSQTYENIEVLVVDDGSNDKTPEIVKSFAQKDKRVTLLQQVNSGVAIARNLAIEKSKGEYIAPIDADDLWSPYKIAKQVECILQAGESCGLVYTWSVRINEFSFIISEDGVQDIEGIVYPALAYCNFVGNASVPLINRKCLEKVGYYNANLKSQNAQGCEDWDLYFRIAEHYEYKVVPEFLMGYRITSQSMSQNFDKMLKSYFLVCQDIRNRHPNIPKKIFRWSEANFYLHFASQCILSKQYLLVFKWWLKAIFTDYIVIFNFKIYKALINLFLGHKKSLTDKYIWHTKDSQQVMYYNPSLNTKITPYKIIQAHRWKKINQLCSNKF